MSSSIVIIGVGFLIAWLGAIMIYLSLRAEPTDLNRRRLGFLGRSFTKANESKKDYEERILERAFEVLKLKEVLQ